MVQGNVLRCELQDVLGQGLGVLIGSGCKRREGLTVAASMAAGGARYTRGEKTAALL
jgi:hypothetical protein